ncbi:MAG TPA: acyl-CoA dehydrogenase family protein [Candidatus Binatia bacterium]|nr:acyl-CoA dehydrogenase family protein [Candidatus Binatia bacterium]
MDFTLTDEQKALSELAGQIFTDHGALDRLKAIERNDEGFDPEAWSALAKTGLLGAALSEEAGGIGGGFVEACLLLEQQGKRVVSVPLLQTVVAGAMPIARFGTRAQRERWLPGILAGEAVLTAALTELATPDPRSPVTVAKRAPSGWRLSGVKVGVPFAERADAIVVPARTDDGRVAVFLVERGARGMTMAREQTMNWEPDARVDLADVDVGPDAVLGSIDSGADVLAWIVDHVTVGLCAIATGVCQEALRITAEYASNRKQFDKPIAMFQAVGQRMADGYIDNEAVSLTMWQAATRLADDMPSDAEIATAKFWAAEAGSRIGHTGLHIHGGISIDVDYPIHRYFLWAKQIEYTLGGATPQLVRLGGLIAGAA